MRLVSTETVIWAGAGVGVVQTVTFKKFDAQWGAFPIIGQYLPQPWSRWSTIGNILFGGIAFGISRFTGLLSRHDYIRSFLQIYGITALIGGIANGVLVGLVPPPPGGGLVRRVVTRQPTGAAVAPQTPTGIPQTKVLA